MNGYLVRLNAGAARPREIVGFFLADDQKHLERLIDECCDADLCEYVDIGAGGIFWSDAAGYVVPPEQNEDDEVPPLPVDPSVTGTWAGALYVDGLKWTRITFPPCAANER